MKEAQVDIAVIGAGPYGLSVGAHLQAQDIDYCVFGEPMHTWRTAMPKGMHLKSDGFASSLSDAKDEFTLSRYCAEENIPYADVGRPMVQIETFIAYGHEFQRRFVKNVDERWVESVQKAPQGFSLRLSDGTEIGAYRVVIAVGITYFAYIPEELQGLPPELCSHSSQHADLDKFSGGRVAIVGGGASALDLAALINQAGASVDVIVRKDAVRFSTPLMVPRPLLEKILRPESGIGPGWKHRFYTDAAPLFHRLPQEYRIDVVQNSLGPCGGWFTRDDVVGKVSIRTETTITNAEQAERSLKLKLRGADGSVDELSYDHVIAATGYRPNLGKIEILDPELSVQITSINATPVLSSHFESSIPGLYLIGPIAANSFGPMMRFAYGSRFVAHRLTRHLVRH